LIRSKPESEDEEYDFADSYGAKYDENYDDQATEPETMGDKTADDLDDNIEVSDMEDLDLVWTWVQKPRWSLSVLCALMLLNRSA